MSGAEHAIIAPSSLARTVQCNASVLMAMPFMNDPPTEETLEGDVAHWVAKQYTDGKTLKIGTVSPVPNGPPVDANMVLGAITWRNEVGEQGISELPLPIQRIHEQCWGTPDRWHWDPVKRLLRLWDYKYGHLFIEVFEFWQGLAYLIGLCDVLDIWGDPDVQLEITLVQPRCYHREGPVRRWRLTVGHLRAYCNIAQAAAAEALGANPRTKVGDECIFCPARHVCSTLQQTTRAMVSYLGRPEPLALGPDAIAVELNLLDEAANLLKARITGLQQQAAAMLRRGTRIYGWSLEPTNGRLNWVVPQQQVLATLDAAGINIRKSETPEYDVMTPTQAIEAGANPVTVSTLAKRPAGESKLVRDDGTKARKIFGASKK